MISEDTSLRTSDGVSIFYNIHRSDRKKPYVVFIHGLRGDSTAWRKEREYFHTKGYPTLALDLRGHGLSEHPKNEGSYEFSKLANDVYEVLEKEHITQPIIVGHCFGGLVSMYFEAEHNISGKLVLVDTSYKAPYLSSLMSDHTLAKRLCEIIAKHAPTAYMHGKRDFEKYVGGPDYNASRVVSDIAHVSLRGYLLCSLQVLKTDARNLLEKISVPTLVVVGSDDSIFPPSVAKDLAHRIRHSHLSVITGANHIIVLNNPRVPSEKIEEFVSS